MSGHDTILILDYGSQYTQLIARRIREMNVYCEIHPCTVALEKAKELAPKGIILSGGPSSVRDDNAPQTEAELWDLGLPILGICYGLQLTTVTLGGQVGGGSHREYGLAKVERTEASPLLNDIPEESWQVWMSHGDHVETLPDGFKVIAKSQSCPVAAVEGSNQVYGVQFHPEVNHTHHGTTLLKNFVQGICRARADWTPESYIEETVKRIREQVGSSRVILGLSGGVDSSVAAMLLHKAIGDKLTCIFVDNGLLRLYDADHVREFFGEKMGMNLVMVDATERFLSQLDGVSDPEQKRKIIGKAFIDVFEAEAAKIDDARFLGQGTIYPDVIESQSFKGPSATIKSHHNVGGLPEHMKLQLVEPLRELFKDEVRQVGLTLGLDRELVMRHPFPGPGLAVRILGEITRERCEVLQRADYIFIEKLKQAGLYNDVAQAFCVLLPVKAVGVMGDERTYENVLALRSVNTTDFMTADFSRLPYDLLAEVSTTIINEVKGINRVTYDISSKPPATIEWE